MESSGRRKRKPSTAAMKLLKTRNMDLVALQYFPRRIIPRRIRNRAALNIFSRLPIDAVFRSKAVCKLWKTYLTDPAFFTAYSSTYVGAILSANYRSCPPITAQVPREAAAAATVVHKDRRGGQSRLILLGDDDQLVGSCNGLVCLLQRGSGQLSVSNPMTCESRRFPQLPEVTDLFNEAFLFGFSSKTGKYKVLWIYQQKDGDRPIRAQVCSVNGSRRDEGWRVIVNQRIPLPLSRGKKLALAYSKYHTCGVTFNGAIHWITKHEDEYDDDDGGDEDYPHYYDDDSELSMRRLGRLISFDIAEEKIQYIPQPGGKCGHRIGLGVLRGCLCIFQAHEGDDSPDHPSLDIWSMNEYGVEESWTKETIENLLAFPCRFHYYHPFIHLSDNEMVALNWDDIKATLVSYNREENTRTDLCQTPFNFRAGEMVPYVPTFLPLDHLLSGERS